MPTFVARGFEAHEAYLCQFWQNWKKCAKFLYTLRIRDHPKGARVKKRGDIQNERSQGATPET